MSNYIYTVSELFHNIKLTLNENFPVIVVVGEVNEININGKSGHVYFTIKDENTSIACVLWKTSSNKYSKYIIQGKEIKITGKLIAFSSNTKIYINAIHVHEHGLGSIQQNFILLKEKLQSQGYFEQSAKQQITKTPHEIGLITSKDGAVIHDIKTTLQKTYPTKISLIDCPMQGEGSVPSIIQAINKFNSLEHKPSFIIIARGGGSNDDLDHFNNEELVKAVFNSKIPIVSAIGHDVDNSLVDLASDLSVSTPTASVAFLANNQNLRDSIINLHNLNFSLLNQKIIKLNNNCHTSQRGLLKPNKIISLFTQNIKQHHDFIGKNFQNNLNKLTMQTQYTKNNLIAPSGNIYRKSSKVKLMIQNMNSLINYKLSNQSKQVEHLYDLLDKTSFKSTLQRGYSLIHQNNQVVNLKSKLTNGTYSLEFFDGAQQIEVKILNHTKTD